MNFKMILMAGAALVTAIASQAQAAAVSTNFAPYQAAIPGEVFGTGTFVLALDGTISASVTAFDSSVVGFGVDAPRKYQTSNFSDPAAKSGGWGITVGEAYYTGIICGYGCGTTVNFTIGNPGDFNSITELYDGGGAAYDFFLFNKEGKGFFGNAVAISPEVPEPATWAMMLAGFGMIGFATRRRQSMKTTVRFA